MQLIEPHPTCQMVNGAAFAYNGERAQAKGVKTSLDTVWNDEIDTLSTLKPSLSLLNYFLPSIDEASLMTGFESASDVAQFFLDWRLSGWRSKGLGLEKVWIVQ